MDFIKVLLFIVGVANSIATIILLFMVGSLWLKLLLVTLALLIATIKLDDLIH